MAKSTEGGKAAAAITDLVVNFGQILDATVTQHRRDGVPLRRSPFLHLAARARRDVLGNEALRNLHITARHRMINQDSNTNAAWLL